MGKIMPIGFDSINIRWHGIESTQGKSNHAGGVSLDRERHQVIHQFLSGQEVVAVLNVLRLFVADVRLWLPGPLFVLIEPDFEFTNGTEILIELLFIPMPQIRTQRFGISQNYVQNTFSPVQVTHLLLDFFFRTLDKKLPVNFGRRTLAGNGHPIGIP